MSGKVAIVTGATGALGEATATGLARLGWSVLLGCRDETRGNRTRSRIAASAPEAEVEVRPFDLSSPTSIRGMVVEFRRAIRPPGRAHPHRSDLLVQPEDHSRGLGVDVRNQPSRPLSSHAASTKHTGEKQAPEDPCCHGAVDHASRVRRSPRRKAIQSAMGIWRVQDVQSAVHLRVVAPSAGQ